MNPTSKPGRLYPVLSDIELTSESDNDNCTSATISVRSGAEGSGGDKQKFYREDINSIEAAAEEDETDEEDEEDDSKKELNERWEKFVSCLLFFLCIE